jgi:hypothetical protein
VSAIATDNRKVDFFRWAIDHPPHRARASVAQNRASPTGEDSRSFPRQGRVSEMADAIHAAMNPVQPAHLETTLDRALSDADC